MYLMQLSRWWLYSPSFNSDCIWAPASFLLASDFDLQISLLCFEKVADLVRRPPVLSLCCTHVGSSQLQQPGPDKSSAMRGPQINTEKTPGLKITKLSLIVVLLHCFLDICVCSAATCLRLRLGQLCVCKVRLLAFNGTWQYVMQHEDAFS
jgi:hypothetical protein